MSRRWVLGGKLAFLLGLTFALVFSVIVASGLPLESCGCFGRLDPPVSVHYAVMFGLLLGGRHLLMSSERGS
ncbi:MAG: hypothetical protein HY292_23195 [Planctomycetes bacterium]|nr:hypothetical protein [Planctomycetota bacterium]